MATTEFQCTLILGAGTRRLLRRADLRSAARSAPPMAPPGAPLVSLRAISRSQSFSSQSTGRGRRRGSTDGQYRRPNLDSCECRPGALSTRPTLPSYGLPNGRLLGYLLIRCYCFLDRLLGRPRKHEAELEMGCDRVTHCHRPSTREGRESSFLTSYVAVFVLSATHSGRNLAVRAARAYRRSCPHFGPGPGLPILSERS